MKILRYTIKNIITNKIHYEIDKKIHESLSIRIRTKQKIWYYDDIHFIIAINVHELINIIVYRQINKYFIY